VFEKLLREILHGKLKPGTALKQEEITKRLGVSRTPVRESIHRLEAEGLVTFIPRRGAVVSTIPLKKVQEIYDIRGRLEGFAAELAVDHLDAQNLDRLATLVREMEKLDAETQLEAILEKNKEFHDIIYSAADNATLVEMIRQLWRDIHRERSQYLLTAHGHRHSTEEHYSILKAIEAKDKTRVHELIVQHCERSKIALLDHTRTEE